MKIENGLGTYQFCFREGFKLWTHSLTMLNITSVDPFESKTKTDCMHSNTPSIILGLIITKGECFAKKALFSVYK